MVLWIAIAALTAVASLSILVPLYRSRQDDRPTSDEKQAIYRDQLKEIDRDLGRGLIGETEAEAARTEIARRLLRASDAAADSEVKSSEWLRKFATGIAAIAVPILALGFYLYLGNPQLADQPLGDRLAEQNEESDIAELVARVEAHLTANPDDARGWELIAPVYSRLGRNDDAVDAYANALRILGANAKLEADMGEAIMRANEDVVTDEARAAFERANQLDKDAIRPRFFLALALDQEGKREEAIIAWGELLEGAPANAPWAAVARRALSRLEGGSSGLEGPSAADVDAAQSLTPEERMGMIGSMVDRLAARLDADPDDAEGWARLIRSYMVLDRVAEAESALDTARQTFADETEKLAIVENEAGTLGLIE